MLYRCTEVVRRPVHVLACDAHSKASGQGLNLSVFDHKSGFMITSCLRGANSTRRPMALSAVVQKSDLAFQRLDFTLFLIHDLFSLQSQPRPVSDLIGQEGQGDGFEKGSSMCLVEVDRFLWLRVRRVSWSSLPQWTSRGQSSARPDRSSAWPGKG